MKSADAGEIQLRGCSLNADGQPQPPFHSVCSLNVLRKGSEHCYDYNDNKSIGAAIEERRRSLPLLLHTDRQKWYKVE